MKIEFLEVVGLLLNYIRGKVDLASFRDSVVAMRMSGNADSNAMKLLGQIEVRYADFADVPVPESLLKGELQALLSSEKWSVPQIRVQEVSSSGAKASAKLQDFESDKSSNHESILIGAAA